MQRKILGFIVIPNRSCKRSDEPQKTPYIEAVRFEDVIDEPFVNDPEVIGVWESLDFVENMEDFVPGQKRWGGNLFLHELDFQHNGKLILKNDKVKNGYTEYWAKGRAIAPNKKPDAKYNIKKMGGETYMFFEWISGDVTIRGMKPAYYVLKKESVGTDIAIEDIKIHPYREGGLYSVTVSIRNKGEGTSPKFGVNFYRGNPGEVKPMTHGAGPIKSQDTWNECSMPFALKEGVNELFVIADPDGSVAESNESNNRAWIKVVVSEGLIKDKNAGFGKARVSKPSIEEAISSAYTWLGLIDNGEYGRSWEETASIFKAHVSQAQWEKALENITKPLGKVISREVISQTPTETVPGAPKGNYVVIQFRTDFENKKGAIETVTPMLEKDGQWRVSGYYIR